MTQNPSQNECCCVCLRVCVCECCTIHRLDMTLRGKIAARCATIYQTVPLDTDGGGYGGDP